MGTQFSMMVFSLLWGVPYLVSAQGLSPAGAGGLVTLFVVCAILIGPVIGLLTGRHPLRRSWLILGIVAANVTLWSAVLVLPGPAPRWLLVALVVVLAAGGPGSVVGFDIARTSNPSSHLGLAQSIVNLGGFLASLAVLATMGAVLEGLGGFTPGAFRIAWLVQYPVWLVAVVGIVVTRRKARRIDAARGVVPRPILEVLSAGLRRG
jgi:MFS family permease